LAYCVNKYSKSNSMFNSGYLIFIEISEPNKAPYLAYVSYGSSDGHVSENHSKNKALEYYREKPQLSKGTKFEVHHVHKFLDIDDYTKVLEGQMSDFLQNPDQ
jgi:hypothetical protein